MTFVWSDLIIASEKCFTDFNCFSRNRIINDPVKSSSNTTSERPCVDRDSLLISKRSPTGSKSMFVLLIVSTQAQNANVSVPNSKRLHRPAVEQGNISVQMLASHYPLLRLWYREKQTDMTQARFVPCWNGMATVQPRASPSRHRATCWASCGKSKISHLDNVVSTGKTHRPPIRRNGIPLATPVPLAPNLASLPNHPTERISAPYRNPSRSTEQRATLHTSRSATVRTLP
jgi:hypothetical protein